MTFPDCLPSANSLAVQQRRSKRQLEFAKNDTSYPSHRKPSADGISRLIDRERIGFDHYVLETHLDAVGKVNWFTETIMQPLNFCPHVDSADFGHFLAQQRPDGESFDSIEQRIAHHTRFGQSVLHVKAAIFSNKPRFAFKC